MDGSPSLVNTQSSGSRLFTFFTCMQIRSEREVTNFGAAFSLAYSCRFYPKVPDLLIILFS